MKSIIVTTTNCKSLDELRAQLLLKTVQMAKKSDIGIIIVSTVLDLKFKKALFEAGAIIIKEENGGMGNSRRQCIKAGFEAGADAVAWIEPEKYPIIPLLVPLFAKLYTDSCHIIIPRRRNLDGYPAYQHFSELRLNHELGNITGRPDIDFSFGPRIFNKFTATYFLDYKGERGDLWDSIFIPVLRALHDSVPVDSIIIDYTHPHEQTEAELEDNAMDRKRDLQRETLICAMRDEAESLGYKSSLEIK